MKCIYQIENKFRSVFNRLIVGVLPSEIKGEMCSWCEGSGYLGFNPKTHDEARCSYCKGTGYAPQPLKEQQSHE